MYKTEYIADRIKSEVKKSNRRMKDMLAECNLSINTVSELSKGKQISSLSLAKIADYLGCSVDYLLGRTSEVEVENAIELTPEEYPVVIKYRAIGERGQVIVDQLLDELHAKKDAPAAYSDERIEAILQNRPELTEFADQIRKLDRNQTLQAIDYIQYILAHQGKN